MILNPKRLMNYGGFNRNYLQLTEARERNTA
jgi:hypothetical protein